MLFNGFGGCCPNAREHDCHGSNNCMWIFLLLLLGNCGCGINGCIDICSLIFLLLLLSCCDDGCGCK
ncbi:MAG: hypothetical protein ACI4T1_02195 [Christensenellales bacterium]